ncbi:MAG: hypothetical protein GX096_02880 [Clostridiales bacterium]|nr:hypothetical protein [Clostridiales bacterium]
MKWMRLNRINRCILTFAALIAIISAPALAEGSISAGDLYAQPPARWQQTYETKWRVIDIDTPVTVPDVTAAPVVKIKRRPTSAFDLSNYEGEWNDDYLLSLMLNNPYDQLMAASSDAARLFVNDDRANFSAIYAEDNPEPLEDAAALYQALALSIGVAPDDVDFAHPIEATVYSREKLFDPATGQYDGDAASDMGMYQISFAQQICGMWLHKHINECFAVHSSGAGGVTPPHNSIAFSSSQSYYALFTLYDVSEIIYPDIPLCSFDTVKQTYEQLIDQGQIRSILDLRLAYVFYPIAGDLESFLAIPTWVMGCEFYQNGKKERPSHYNKVHITETDAYGELLVNVQTGELVDPYNSSKTRINPPEIMLWE